MYIHNGLRSWTGAVNLWDAVPFPGEFRPRRGQRLGGEGQDRAASATGHTGGAAVWLRLLGPSQDSDSSVKFLGLGLSLRTDKKQSCFVFLLKLHGRGTLTQERFFQRDRLMIF